jgi:uncharacterized membrane protein YfcA
MTVLAFTLILLPGAYLAGLAGSLTGLGGGAVTIPLRYVIGAALLAELKAKSKINQ